MSNTDEKLLSDLMFVIFYIQMSKSSDNGDMIVFYYPNQKRQKHENRLKIHLCIMSYERNLLLTKKQKQK